MKVTQLITNSAADILKRRPSFRPGAVTAQLLEGPHALAFLATAWPTLYERDVTATPYQSPAWLNAHAQQLPATATPLVVAVTTSQGPAAALALVRDLGQSGPTVRPLSSPAAEYVRAVGPGVDEPAIADAFAGCLNSLARTSSVQLPDLPTDSSLGQALIARPQWRHTTTPYAIVPLPVAYEALSRATRRDHTRRQRKWDALAADHSVVYRRTRTTPELLDAYDVLADLHRRRWAGSEPQPATEPAADDTQWRTLLQTCGSDTAFIATLTLGDSTEQQVVAAQLCLYRNHRAYSLCPAHDPAHQHIAPGHALLRRLCADLAEAGFVGLDLGRTRTDPKQLRYKAQYRPSWQTTSTFTAPLDGTEEFSRAPSSSVGASPGAADLSRHVRGGAGSPTPATAARLTCAQAGPAASSPQDTGAHPHPSWALPVTQSRRPTEWPPETAAIPPHPGQAPTTTTTTMRRQALHVRQTRQRQRHNRHDDCDKPHQLGAEHVGHRRRQSIRRQEPR
ncbi:GNAT family N-acetyltransferase [Streptomyces sp. NPDC002402]